MGSVTDKKGRWVILENVYNIFPLPSHSLLIFLEKRLAGGGVVERFAMHMRHQEVTLKRPFSVNNRGKSASAESVIEILHVGTKTAVLPLLDA